jgi:hypothetical protein
MEPVQRHTHTFDAAGSSARQCDDCCCVRGAERSLSQTDDPALSALCSGHVRKRWRVKKKVLRGV